MRVRIRPDRVHRHPTFRRVGRTWTPDWQEVGNMQLSPEQMSFLTGPESSDILEVEGHATPTPPPGTPKEAVVAAGAAGVSLPGHPSVTEASRLSDEEPPRRPSRGRKAEE